MTSTLTPPTASSDSNDSNSSTSDDDVLCLRDAPAATISALAKDARFDATLAAACLTLCEGRPDLLAHAMWSPREGAPLRPMGTLFGDEAVNYGSLSSAIVRLCQDGTALTAAVLRLGRPVWTTSIPRFGWHGLGAVLRNHGIQSAGAFPIVVGSHVGAVIELLSFDKLQFDLSSEALMRQIAPMIAEVYRPA